MGAKLERKTLNVSQVEFKADVEKRTIEGYASVFGVRDWYDDIVHKGAFLDSLAEAPQSKLGAPWVPVLWQHQDHTPIGLPLKIGEDERGLAFTAKISKTEDGNKALELAHDGVVTGVSIGYWARKWDREDLEINNDGDTVRVRNLYKVDLMEISPVTFPANEAARITGAQKSVNDAAVELVLKAVEQLHQKAGLVIDLDSGEVQGSPEAKQLLEAKRVLEDTLAGMGVTQGGNGPEPHEKSRDEDSEEIEAFKSQIDDLGQSLRAFRRQ